MVASVGAMGNLLTLLSVPWAKANKLLGFNKPPLKYTTVFIITLPLLIFSTA